MNAAELNARIRESLAVLIDSADELRELDQALGDGDLGITISAGSTAVIDALEALPAETTPTEIARASAKAFANANPSTMAALVAGALLAGSRVWADVSEITIDDAQRFADAAGTSISQRGKTQLGDKTIYDGLAAVADALVGQVDAEVAVNAAVRAADDAVERTKGLQSRRGRASWLQERSIGKADPGATALLRFVESWRATSPAAAGAD
ncbi:DAK2 domain-containing protein [Microbacterium sp. zg.Y625]|uniref:DAK2 domain-containing protein n=1 Tax=Microbacterium jiangjiandongii TaxID=3049071 RepID=UPI00214CFC10|nr:MULTISPECIES: DAK2 domain-containing protein [unclassified Microbacterium]MCR2793517.1 DAK2 domain-containing protein [Microbacterium sp. zg.Y625]MCR2815883.1 DAK2 domain-containing protein [Microbacterium sp. zg.Y843]WIM25871.1 DAK2 domain-containing protein [Microbacterium sp. zg-Y625]